MGQAMLRKAQGDVAVLNGGGIRDSIPSGLVTYKSILQVYPFGSTLVYVDMTGAEAQAYLKTIAQYKVGSGAFAHLVGVTWKETASGKEIFIQNKPVVPTKTYRIVLNSFIAMGGDGYPTVNHHPKFVNTGFVDAMLLRDAIYAQSPIKTHYFN
jgi:5'-nucleotidase/UDP-sugar diphosphatase